MSFHPNMDMDQGQQAAPGQPLNLDQDPSLQDDTDRRDALAIFSDIRTVSLDMAGHLDDPNYLAECVEIRGRLMKEFDAYRAKNPQHVNKEILRPLANEILIMDQKIYSSLEKHMSDTKEKIINIRKQQRELKYKANKPAPAGSYMQQSK